MAALFPLDSDDSAFRMRASNIDSETDISVFAVNTEDNSDLSFSEDEEEEREVGWNRDPTPVNVNPFVSRVGAVSRIAVDGTARHILTFRRQ